jgi:SAM-dependent methyltransferase
LWTKISRGIVEKFSLSDFDLVLATAVLHHLDDDEAVQLFEVAREVLKPGGRLITLDGCFVADQSSITRFILSRDRGRYVRTKDAYLSLAQKSFKDVQLSIHHDLIRIPYTHIIMECMA